MTANDKVTGPRRFCEPPEAFGKLGVKRRAWRQPTTGDAADLAQFRAAVMQNAICVHLREFKNNQDVVLTELARRDGRVSAKDMWSARLNGRENLTLADIAIVIAVLPGAMPTSQQIGEFMEVAEGGSPPPDWPWKDSI